MSDIITIRGFVATEPRHIRNDSLIITDFRIATSQGYWNRTKKEWVEQDSNFYSVSTYGDLAENVNGSVHKREPVIITGRLRVKEWVSGEKKGKDVEIVADAIGHDLSWGASQFKRTRNVNVNREADDAFPSAAETPAEPASDNEQASLPINDEREEVATPF
ncbi:single-stranded DNA-binding protein [Cryobacterium sp. BB307]|uniref:single-stranded DNA-binding protein n=1 Tax=Cryobacterium sp. BB307 TaxID=2716317 RepID=UPI001444A486|nr:single-stranded DNA-binding protein [Cryobacterium sp. BB307]